jgi:hypothetical protein
VDGWNEFVKDLREMEAEEKQRDAKFKLSIDPAMRGAAIDKLIRVVLNRYSDLFNEVEKEFSEDEINLIEERIEVPDSIGTYNREVLKKHITDLLQLIITDKAQIKRISEKALEKFKGKGKFYIYDDLISYIEILRRYENDKKEMKHSLKKAKDFVLSFNKETGKNIKVRTFNSFLDKIDQDYSEIYNSFFEGKKNLEILLNLKMKLHFNVKM